METTIQHNQGMSRMKRTLTSLVPVLAVAAALFVAGCSKSSAPSGPYGASSAPVPPGQPNTVVMANMAFGPASITVSTGTTVTWQNNDGVAHTSTSDTGAWDTGTIAPGQSKTTVFNTPGTFTYHCTVHPMMLGTVVVH